jgi:predicted nucleotidyltransferase
MNALESAILTRFKELLLRRIKLHRLTLFGSRARGDADPSSDLDVLVVLEGSTNREVRDFVSDCAWEAGFDHGIVVVPVVFSREEWENGPESHSLLAQAVEAEGVSI